jgi:hypothetical protein
LGDTVLLHQVLHIYFTILIFLLFDPFLNKITFRPLGKVNSTLDPGGRRHNSCIELTRLDTVTHGVELRGPI